MTTLAPPRTAAPVDTPAWRIWLAAWPIGSRPERWQ